MLWLLIIIHGQFMVAFVLWLLIHYLWSIYGCISVMVTYILFMVNFHQCYGYIFIIHGQFMVALVLWLLIHYSW